LTRGSGTLTLAADGTITSSAFDERRITAVTFRLDGVQAAQAKVNIAGVGNVTLTGTWVPAATQTNPDGSNATPATAQGYTRFDWDATTATGNNGPAVFTYTLTAQDASGANLGAAQSGRIVVDPNHARQPVQLQRQVKTLNLDDGFVASTWRTYTAFGELNEELDDRVVERAEAILGRTLSGTERFTESTRYRYNTLGKLVARTEATANATAENGFAARVRAVTAFGYDLLGRLNTQTDANGNRILQGLRAGSADAVVLRSSADGDRHIDYNDFGEVLRVADEAGNKTTTVHDQLGQVTKVTRGGVWRTDLSGVRIRNTANPNDEVSDTYSYDALGHQVTHTDALGQTFHTDYDGLGRVVATWSPTLHITRYEYGIVGVVGLGGATSIGTRKITRLASGMSLTDDQDQFGHTTRHVDLSGTEYTYRYDGAGRLAQQTSGVHAGQVNGQNISFDYYANGALKTQSDNVTGTLTDYAYDDTGLRSGEAYYRTGTGAAAGLRVATFQSDTLAYDELGRLREVADANNYKVRYEYDAVGNRRLNDASYWDGAAWRQQATWSLYDPMNRLVVAKGALVNAADGKPAARGSSQTDTSVRIVAGSDGVSLAYDALGHRVRASYTVKDPAKPGDAGRAVTEAYDVSGDGVVLAVRQQDGLKVARRVDTIGRTLQERDYQNNTLTDSNYDAENRLLSQHLADFKNEKREADTTTTYFYEQAVGSASTAASATGAGALARTVSHNDKNKAPDLTTTYTYEYWDDARQKKVEKAGQSSGSAELRYDASGYLVEQKDKAVGLTTNFFNSANGLVVQRERMQNSTQVGFHKFFYADGKRVGDIRNDPGDNAHLTYAEDLAQRGQTPPDNTQLDRTFKPVVVADFDQNFEPVNGGSPAGSAGSYVVRQGDTLQGVALQLWGDASLWYLIAERSGLSSSPGEPLTEGQVLQVPNQVTNVHHNSQTLRPYNPAEAIGNVDPSLPPAVLDDNKCATYAKIIVVVIVAVVATVATAGAAAPAAASAGGIFATGTAVLTGGAGLSLGVVGAAAVGGAVGSIVSQGVAMGLKLQDEFSWKQVGQAALGSAVTAGVGAELRALDVMQEIRGVQGALNAAGRSALGTGSNLLLHTDWNWRQIMAGAAGAAAGAAVGSALEGSRLGNLLGDYGSRVVSGFAGAAVQGRAAARGDDHVDYGGLFVNTLGNVLGDSIAGGMQPRQGVGPWSAADYRNGSDVESDLAYDARRAQEGANQSDVILARRAAELSAASLTQAQVRALQGGAGPLTDTAAQQWLAFEDEPIGPAANGRQLPPSKAQQAASAALRARIAQTASDFWGGSGQFAPTTADNQSLWSAVKDTARVPWNLLMDAGQLAETATPLTTSLKYAAYRSLGLDIPRPSDLRATYDTPAFGLTMEVLEPMVPLGRLLGAPRSLGGATFVDGVFVHDLKPLTNLELYGQAITRTPDEALQLLQRVGHDAETLAEYRIVKLSDADYAARSKRLGFDFDATYGNVPRDIPSVSFRQNIASPMADGTSKIPVYVRQEVFDSDEAIVQILSHEIHETQSLKYVAARPISATDYKDLVRGNLKGNLHYEAVQEGDWWLQRFRDLRAGKN